MAEICIVTWIGAPVERCFQLARDIDFHTRSLALTGERAVGGRTSGLIGLGESVTWEARHFWIQLRFTAKVTVFDPPCHFRDVMVAGTFKSFVHDHRFESRAGGTRMTDEIVFRSPFGVIGVGIDVLLMAGYLRRLIRARSQAIKLEAEKDTPQQDKLGPSPAGPEPRAGDG